MARPIALIVRGDPCKRIDHLIMVSDFYLYCLPQNRGCGFSLEEGHFNVAGPRKLTFHTIIPCMLTQPDTGKPKMEKYIS